MSFVNPNGLWFLLGIPLLILLYILKQKYAERLLSSSFIWRKSQHLIKNKIRWRKLLKYVLAALQILCVTMAALTVARPVSAAQAAAVRYIVILDGSGSMQAVSDGESRFERAEDEISDLAADMSYGSTMSVIYAGDSASFIVENTESDSAVRRALKSLECGWAESDVSGAITLAMSETTGDSGTQILLYTDTDYTGTGDIQVINMAASEYNAAVLSLSAEALNEGFSFTGSVASYGADMTLTLGLYVDGSLCDAQLVDCTDSAATDVTFEETDLESFSQAELRLESEDAIDSDNSYYFCPDTDSEKNILLVSESPLFLETALEAVGDYNVSTTSSLDAIPVAGAESDSSDTTESSETSGELTGYDLYIFDGILPDSLPDDGAVWIVNPDSAPQGSGLSIGSSTAGAGLTAVANNNSGTYTQITSNLDVSDVVVSDFMGLSSYSGYETILSCDGEPVLLAKETDDYQKIVVLSFDLHDSNLPLMSAFPVLVYNLTQYSLPSILDERDYTVGDAVALTALPGSISMQVDDESGTATTLALSSEGSLFTPAQAGLYTVQQITESNSTLSTAEDAFFVHMSASESNIYPQGSSLGLGTASADETTDASGWFSRLFSGQIKIWPYLVMLLLLTMLAEWGLYYREEL